MVMQEPISKAFIIANEGQTASITEDGCKFTCKKWADHTIQTHRPVHQPEEMKNVRYGIGMVAKGELLCWLWYIAVLAAFWRIYSNF